MLSSWQSTPSSEGSQPAAIDDFVTYVQVDDPESFYLYSFRPPSMYAQTSRYGKSHYVPLLRQVSSELAAHDLSTLLSSDMFYHSAGDSALEFELRVVGDTAEIHLNPSQVNDKTQMYSYIEVELQTLWATLTQNCSYIKNVRVTCEGVPFKSPFEFVPPLPETDDQGYVMDDLNLPDYSAVELAELRRNIPYRQVIYPVDWVIESLPEHYIDIRLQNSIRFLVNATAWAPNPVLPSTSFTSVEDADPRFIIDTATMFATLISYVDWSYNDESLLSEPDTNHATLIPLQQSTSDIHGKLKEHVEAAAKLIFGEDVVCRHQPSTTMRYDEYGGVYLYRRLGGYVRETIPVITDLREDTDNYQLSVYYVRIGTEPYSGDPLSYLDNEGNLLPPEMVPDYCRQNLPEHRITLAKHQDGRLLYAAHILPEE